MSSLIRQLWSAFLLQEEAYAHMREDTRRLQRGLILVLAVGVLVGVAGAWSQVVDWAFSPDMNKVQSVVLDHLTKMPWYTEASTNPEFVAEFTRWYDLGWQIAKTFASSPTGLIGIITTPLQLLVVWLIYGCLAHLSARLLGGQASLGQTLACTALAVAPQLLNLILVIPFATVAGVGTWTLACNFVAIQQAHGLTTWRALAATLLPPVVLALVGSLFACCGMAVIVPALSTMGGMR